MNDDFSEFELEMHSLRPLRPSRSLEGRLAELLDVSAVAVPPLPWYQRLGFTRPLAALAWSFATPATAVLAVAAIMVVLRPLNGLRDPATNAAAVTRNNAGHLQPSLPAAEPPRFEPAVASNVLYQARDEGVVYDDTNAPVRRVRLRSEDTLAWRNPRTGAQWEVSYPREDVLQLPLDAK